MALELITHETDVSADIKRMLIEQDAQVWRNTRFQAESRRRTYIRIGHVEQAQAQAKLLEECEAALLDLEEQLKEL
jgi:hypothetical protein